MAFYTAYGLQKNDNVGERERGQLSFITEDELGNPVVDKRYQIEKTETKNKRKRKCK